MDLDIWSYLARQGVRIRGADDDFFAEGDAVCSMRSCQYLTEDDCEEFLHTDLQPFSCSAPGCQATFSQLVESESHYNARHRHSCNTCHHSLPSAHLLELHVLETHDTYFQLLAAKKASYECFLERCGSKFWSPRERKEHCVKTHSFSPAFEFDNKALLPKQKSRKKSRKTSTSESKNNVQMRSQQQKAGSLSPEATKKPVTKRPPKARPVSVYVAPMDTTVPSPAVKPTYSRRLSLNTHPVTETHTESLELQSATKRAPLSLARMGERLTNTRNSISTIDVSRIPGPPTSITSAVLPPLVTSSKTNSVSTNAIHHTPRSRGRNSLTGLLTSPRKGSSQIPLPTRISNNGDLRKLSTASSTTTTTTSSPDRSLTGSPVKSRSSASVNSTCFNNPQPPHGEDNRNNNSQKSRIPVLRSSSYKVPKNVCFGHGMQKVFHSTGNKKLSYDRHWYHRGNETRMETTTMSIDKVEFNDMKMALD